MSGTNPLQITDPNAASDNPLLGGTPTQGAALAMTGSALGDWLAAQRAKSAQMGLWNPQTGLPTGAGLVNAAGQYGNALMMGTAAPGTPHFALDPYDLKPADNLTRAQQGAVDHYAAGSSYLNGDSPEAETLRSHLDAAINGSKLGDNARLYRGFSLPTEDIEKVKAGDIIPLSSGYVSTTTSKETAQNFADDDTGGDASVLAELRVPRGHAALHIPTDQVAEAELGGPQNEVLLPRGTQFRVHSINEKSDGNYQLLAVPETTAQ